MCLLLFCVMHRHPFNPQSRYMCWLHIIAEMELVILQIWTNIQSHLYLLSTAVNCGTLSNPANGRVSYTAGTTFGRTATYTCNTGYSRVGSSTRTCQSTGVWSGSAPTCQGRIFMCSCNKTKHLVLSSVCGSLKAFPFSSQSANMYACTRTTSNTGCTLVSKVSWHTHRRMYATCTVGLILATKNSKLHWYFHPEMCLLLFCDTHRHPFNPQGRVHVLATYHSWNAIGNSSNVN